MTEPALIVLVDDDPDKRFLLERLLGRAFPQNKVVSLEDCASALPIVDAPIPKVVVTNGKIAGEDGIEFASYVARKVHAPIVMVTLRSYLRESALAAGVSAFVETGADEEIRQAVQGALESLRKS